MLNEIDLKQIERKAFRSTYQDGLLDINLGAIIAGMAIFLHHPENGYSAINTISFVLVFGIFNSLFMLGKKYITLPRMGQVRFGPVRQKKSKTLAIILAAIVFLQVLVVGLSIISRQNPSFGEKLFGDYNTERLAVAAVGSLFVGPSMLVIAYLTDFTRGFYIAPMMALAVFLMILIDQPIYPVVIGGLIILSGVVLFIRFLKKYPLPEGE